MYYMAAVHEKDVSEFRYKKNHKYKYPKQIWNWQYKESLFTGDYKCLRKSYWAIVSQFDESNEHHLR